MARLTQLLGEFKVVKPFKPERECLGEINLVSDVGFTLAGLLNSEIGTQQLRLKPVVQNPKSLIKETTTPAELEIVPAKKQMIDSRDQLPPSLLITAVNSNTLSDLETEPFANFAFPEIGHQKQTSSFQGVQSLATIVAMKATTSPQYHVEKTEKLFIPDKAMMVGNTARPINQYSSLLVQRDTVENDSIQQYIPLNSDNDNGSPWVKKSQEQGGQTVEITQKHIPEKYDFEKTGYGVDDDLYALNLQWKNIPPNFALTGFYDYKIVLLPNDPGGDLRAR